MSKSNSCPLNDPACSCQGRIYPSPDASSDARTPNFDSGNAGSTPAASTSASAALPKMPTNVAPPIGAARNQQLTELQAENGRLKSIAVHLHWMARRYADGRQSYATSLHNENTRELIAMGVPLNATGDGTLWARDSGGRAYDGLTNEEAALGRDPDWKHDDKERRIEEQDKLLDACREVLAAKHYGNVGVSCNDVADLLTRPEVRNG